MIFYREEQNYWIQAKHKTTETNFGLLDKLLCLIRTSQLKKTKPFQKRKLLLKNVIFWKENNKNKSKVDNTHNINQNNNNNKKH